MSNRNTEDCLSYEGKGRVQHQRSNICRLEELQRIGWLGRGAFGVVTLVKNPSTNRKYALKEVSKDLLKSKQQMKIILREKEIMERLFHPRIVTL